MVMKEMRRASEDAKCTFLKEVCKTKKHNYYRVSQFGGFIDHPSIQWRFRVWMQYIIWGLIFFFLYKHAQLSGCCGYLQVQLLKSLNHPNVLQFIGILYREGKTLNLITGESSSDTIRSSYGSGPCFCYFWILKFVLGVQKRKTYDFCYCIYVCHAL